MSSKEKKRAFPKLRFPEFRDAGPWEVKRLREVFRFKQGVQVPIEKQSNKKEPGMVRFIRIVDLTQKGEPWRFIANPGNEYIVKSDDLFMIRYGTPGVIAIGYEGAIANNLFRLIWKGTENFHPKFWFYIFNRLEKTIFNLSCSSSMPAIKFPVLYEVSVRIPKSPEQQKIADCLSSLDKLIELQTKKLKALEDYKKGLMQKLFPSEGETTPRLRFPEFRDAPEWEVKRLGDIGPVLMCKRILKKQTSEVGEIPFYKIGTFGKKPDAYISKELYEKYKETYPFPRKGEILISASGTIGRTVVYDGKPAYFQDSNILWIANDENIVLNIFLNYCYKRIKWQTDNNTIARLYNDNLKRMKIVIPSIPEQQKIADCLSSLDKLIELQTKKLEALKNHKKGLMQKLFPQEVG